MERPTDEALRKAQTTLRGLVSDGPTQLPSLNLVADSIRLELEKSGRVALLYVNLSRYGRLEPVFGWHIVAEILDAVAANLEGMVGGTLRRLDVVSDFTLTDDAFIVLLSPPRSAAVIADDDLAAVTRRVYERLQSLLLNDLAPGVYDRVHPSVGSAVLAVDEALTFEQNLQHGLALAMQAAEEQAALYDRDLEATLADCVSRGDLEPLFEPVVDPARRGGDRLPQQRARPLLLAAQAAGRAARRGAPLPGAGLVRRGRPGDHGVGGGRARAGRPAVPRLRRR